MRERGTCERSEEGCGGRCELRLRGERGISQEKGRKTGDCGPKGMQARNIPECAGSYRHGHSWCAERWEAWLGRASEATHQSAMVRWLLSGRWNWKWRSPSR